MKQVSQDMQSWVNSNLSSLQVLECAYGHYDIEKGTFMAIPMIQSWYYEYLEKGLDLLVADRLKSKMNYWSHSDQVYSNYHKHIRKNYTDKFFYKFDLVNKIPEGYELLAIGVHKKLSNCELLELQRAFRVISYQASQIRKRYPNSCIELRAYEAVHDLFHIENKEKENMISQYEKSKFGDIILTPKEQQYIEYTLFNLTHKEISYKHNCSQTAVRKVISNIKRKLGNEYMPTSSMLIKLNEIGALGLCSRNFVYNS